MSLLIEYVYYHFYSLVSIFRKHNAREAAIIYVSIVMFLITFPWVAFLVFKAGGKGSRLLFMVTFVTYAFLIHFFNSKYIQRKVRIDKMLKSYKHQSKSSRIIGYIVVLGLLVLAPLVGFWILSML